jgi:L-threonylcarbamoyladenylate synthase
LKIISGDEALKRLLSGEVVAIPTETVYGLAAWIKSHAGLQKIFSVKERPFFDPLIVHVANSEAAKSLTPLWTKAHDILAKKFWPGPLTLIAKKSSEIDPLITSGLDSVGLRCPHHPLTLELLAKIEGGLAAPSANKFGKTSPTSAEHVFEEFGNSVSILDGGSCEVGIESTVVGVSEANDEFQIQIFRPGHITASQIEKALSEAGLKAHVGYAQSPVAPGQLKHHYMPKIPLVVVPDEFKWDLDRKKIEDFLGQKFNNPIFWQQPRHPNLASRELYQKMREFDQEGYDLILAAKNAESEEENWKGIWNRLEKAKSFSLI